MSQNNQLNDEELVNTFVRAVREKNFEKAAETHNEIIRRGIKYNLEATGVKLNGNQSAGIKDNSIKLKQSEHYIFQEVQRILPAIDSEMESYFMGGGDRIVNAGRSDDRRNSYGHNPLENNRQDNHSFYPPPAQHPPVRADGYLQDYYNHRPQAQEAREVPQEPPRQPPRQPIRKQMDLTVPDPNKYKIRITKPAINMDSIPVSKLNEQLLFLDPSNFSCSSGSQFANQLTSYFQLMCNRTPRGF